jgi:hypothetical protein
MSGQRSDRGVSSVSNDLATLAELCPTQKTGRKVGWEVIHTSPPLARSHRSGAADSRAGELVIRVARRAWDFLAGAQNSRVLVEIGFPGAGP